MLSWRIFLVSSSRSSSIAVLNTFAFFEQYRGFKSFSPMANSKWDYVKLFEAEEVLLPNCWAVARIDGRGFHKLAKKHNWKRPNDERGLRLMNKAAKSVMAEYNDIILSYGQSDEYSFVFRREAEVFQRRSTKIITTLVSKFASAFVFNWKECFPDVELQYPPSFDGRIVLYPTDQNLRDYLCWRQADCHINNLYNTTFWALVLQGGLSNNDAQRELSGTLSADKNEILFSRFNINYNNEPELYRKGSVLVQPIRNRFQKQLKQKKNNAKKDMVGEKDGNKNSATNAVSNNNTSSKSDQDHCKQLEEAIIELNCDIIGPGFWAEYPYLLDPNAGKELPLPSKNDSKIEVNVSVVTDDVEKVQIK